MEPIVLDDIPCKLDIEQLAERLHIEAGSNDGAELEALAAEAQAIVRPKAMYKAAFISSKEDNSVTVEGVPLRSRVLRVNLHKVYRVFVYAATCGTEIDDWAQAIDDMLHQYWAEAIKLVALRSARRALDTHLVGHHRPGKTSTMAPGSLMDWPLTQQRPLFAILGDPESAIGVRLTKSCLMVPNKSGSGIRFPTEESFESCQLCPMPDCPGRRASYDKDLYDRKFRLKGD